MGIPTKQRIRRPAEFRNVFSRGKRASGSYTNIAACQNGLSYSRFGLSVSKRVGNAVNRNFVKRRIRHALVDMDVSNGWDVVVTAKPPASAVPFSMLDQAMQASLRRLGIVIHSGSTTNSKNVTVGE